MEPAGSMAAWASATACSCCSSSLTRVFQCSRLVDRSRTVIRSCRICCCFWAQRCFHRSRLARSFLVLRAAFLASFITPPRRENSSLAGPESSMKYYVRKSHRLDSLVIGRLTVLLRAPDLEWSHTEDGVPGERPGRKRQRLPGPRKVCASPGIRSSAERK